MEQIGVAVTFYAFFSASRAGKTGLTVTVDVYRAGSLIVTAGSATAVGGGLYSYQLSSGSVTVEGEYVAIFKTTDTTVDMNHVPALWSIGRAGIEDLDATISSRAVTGAAMTLTSGERDAVAAALLDLANGVETGWTLRQALRIVAAVLAGKSTGAGSGTEAFRDLTDTKARVTATISESNRTAITYDKT
jgi:hypothetical protein